MNILLFSIPFFLTSLTSPALTLIPNEALSAIEIRWSSIDATVTEYYLYKFEAGKEWQLHQVIYGDETSYVDWQVRPQTSYRYCLQAKFKDGQFSPCTKPIQAVWD